MSTPFLLVVKKKREQFWVLQISWKSQTKKPIGSRSSLNEHIVRVKTLMGLGPFEVRFFFRKKFTKFDLAFQQDIKNRSKVIWGLSLVFSTIWPKHFFFVKSLMGTSLDLIFFTQNFFFQLVPRAQGGIQMKICFGTIEDLPIWFFSNKGIFVSQNSYGYTSSFSIDFFVFLRSDQKLLLYWLVLVSTQKNWIKII